MDILGHQNVIRFLEQGIKNHSLVHSYLFVGPSHIGKMLVAKTMAASLIYQEKPCFRCLSSSEVEKNIHPDILEVGPLSSKEKIGIDQIRGLKKKMALTPFSGRYKIAIIDEAERLTGEAANSLLKLLEETTAKSILILIASSPKAVLPTVRSRCQIIRFSSPSQKEIEAHLMKVYGLDPQKAKRFYTLSLGKPGLALEYLKKAELLEQAEERASRFIALLNNPEDLDLRSEISEKIDIKSLLIWLQIVRDLILLRLGLPSSGLLRRGALVLVLKKYPLSRLIEMVRNIGNSIFYLEHNVNHKLVAGNLIFSF